MNLKTSTVPYEEITSVHLSVCDLLSAVKPFVRFFKMMYVSSSKRCQANFNFVKMTQWQSYCTYGSKLFSTCNFLIYLAIS